MKPFTFLSDNKREQSLLNDENVINYFTNAGPMYEREFAWCSPWHITQPFWLLRSFTGTMEEFFEDRLGIPVIHSIDTPTHLFTHELMIHPNYTAELPNFAEDDIITIKYYEYI